MAHWSSCEAGGMELVWWSGVGCIELGCCKQHGEHERREERLLLLRDCSVATGALKQLACLPAEHLIHCSFCEVTFFLKVSMSAADLQANNAVYNELTALLLSHCCSRKRCLETWVHLDDKGELQESTIV